MERSDLDTVLRIEQAAYAFPWTAGNFADSLAQGYWAECAVTQAQLVGYYLAMPVLDEMHLLNLTVDPAWQGRGLGRWLLRQLLARSRQAGASSLWLEVRPSNPVAIALYQSEGFVQAGRRRHYYPAAGGQREDALLFERRLAPPAPGR
jgi:ribosomal-protein-alanine N-acetyltransferase